MCERSIVGFIVGDLATWIDGKTVGGDDVSLDCSKYDEGEEGLLGCDDIDGLLLKLTNDSIVGGFDDSVLDIFDDNDDDLGEDSVVEFLFSVALSLVTTCDLVINVVGVANRTFLGIFLER